MDQDLVKAEVIEDHFAHDSSQLDLRVGDFVYILEKDDSGWWGGHKEGDETTGWFPYNVVRPLQALDQVAAPRAPEAVVPQNIASSASTSVNTHATEQTFEKASAHHTPSMKVDTKEYNQPDLVTMCESPTRKARWPASPMMRDTAQNPGPSNIQSKSTADREVIRLKEELKIERSKHKEELTVERGHRESLEAQRVAHNAEIAQLHEVQDALKRQNSKLEKDNADLRMRLHEAEAAHPQQTVGNEAEQLRRIQEQLSHASRQEEKIWHAVEKNVSAAILMQIKADAPQEPVAQPMGGPPVEVARRLFSASGESSPAVRARAESAHAFVGNVHTSDSWAKPPMVPRSATQLGRPAASSREGTPVKNLRPFSCNDLQPDEAPARGAVANIVRRLERVGSTPPRRNYEHGNASSRQRTPQNSPTASNSQGWAPPLQIDGGDHDEPVNFGMSPISTARAQNRMHPEDAVSNNKGNDAGPGRSPTPGSASSSSLVKNRIRQLENGA
jgi:hypothetical protein